MAWRTFIDYKLDLLTAFLGIGFLEVLQHIPLDDLIRYIGEGVILFTTLLKIIRKRKERKKEQTENKSEDE